MNVTTRPDGSLGPRDNLSDLCIRDILSSVALLCGDNETAGMISSIITRPAANVYRPYPLQTFNTGTN
jgi:hypothetical protein